MKLPDDYCRSTAGFPYICSFPAAAVPCAVLPTLPRHVHSRTTICSPFCAVSGGTPEAIMQRPEMIAALLPALRADLALVEGYAVDPGHRIPCPITAFGGADDLPHSGPPSPGETSPVEIFGPAHSPEDIFTWYPLP